jgi:hypothetical protein
LLKMARSRNNKIGLCFRSVERLRNYLLTMPEKSR